MKRLTAAFALMLACSLLMTVPAEAQQHQHRGQQGQQGRMQGYMMGPGMAPGGMMPMMHRMHQRMMENPMHRASMMTFMLPALADTLGLSDQQAERLRQLKSEALARHQGHQQQMQTQRQQLTDLFEADGQPSPDSVRQHLMAMAELRADQRATLYETGHQMRQVLTDEQRQSLSGMSSHQRMHQMMAHMTVMDMMQMMRVLHGGRMGARMAPGGMMGPRPDRPRMPNRGNR